MVSSSLIIVPFQQAITSHVTKCEMQEGLWLTCTGPGPAGAGEAPRRNCKRVAWLESRGRVRRFPLSNKYTFRGEDWNWVNMVFRIGSRFMHSLISASVCVLIHHCLRQCSVISVWPAGAPQSGSCALWTCPLVG